MGGREKEAQAIRLRNARDNLVQRSQDSKGMGGRGTPGRGKGDPATQTKLEPII